KVSEFWKTSISAMCKFVHRVLGVDCDLGRGIETGPTMRFDRRFFRSPQWPRLFRLAAIHQTVCCGILSETWRRRKSNASWGQRWLRRRGCRVAEFRGHEDPQPAPVLR